MTIVNAKLLRIDVAGTPSTAGEPTWTTGLAIDVECCMDSPTSSERFTLGATIKEADATLFVDRDDVGAGAIAEGYRLRAQLDGEAVKTYRVVFCRVRVLEGLDHYEVFLKTE